MSVLLPDPSDRDDFDMISCRASDAGMKKASSNSPPGLEIVGEGVKIDIMMGINGVKSL